MKSMTVVPAAIAATPIAIPKIAAPTVVVAAVVIRAPEVTRPVVSVVPGPGSDEDSAHEVLRTVVSVWRTRVRIVTVVSVRADRRSGNITRTDINTNSDLRPRGRR